jgi:AcrR family transcriptional regulator
MSKGNATKATVKGETLRKAILDAASKLFIERGLGGTGMQDIADALGVTRTAVYYYYKNKEAILESLTEDVTLLARRMTAEVVARTQSEAGKALRGLVEQYARLILSRPFAFRVAERNESELPPKLRAAAETARRSVLENFTNVIERGVRAGEFRVVDARIAAFALLGMCNWTAWWFQAGGRKTEGEVAEILTDLAVHALKRDARRTPREADVHESIRLLREDLAYLEKQLAPAVR